MPDRISYSASFGFAQVDFSRTGTLVYRRASEQSLPRWLDGAGKVWPAAAEARQLPLAGAVGGWKPVGCGRNGKRRVECLDSGGTTGPDNPTAVPCRVSVVDAGPPVSGAGERTGSSLDPL